MTVHLRNVSMLNPFVRLFSGLNTAEEEEKEEKHIHVWREKVGQFNQSKDNESTWNARDLSLIPGLGRSPGGGHGNPLQYSCLKNPHEQKSLAGYSPWGCKESDTTGRPSSAQHKDNERGFPGGSDVKESACNAGDLDSIPGLGRSPGEGNAYPLQYSYMDNPMDRGTWQATVHGVSKSRTQLSDRHFHFS